MGAVAVLKGRRKERETPLEKFFTGPGTTGLKDGEIFVRIEAPALKAHSGGAYIKLGVRRAMEIALVGVAAMVRLDGKNGTVKDVRITLGAVAPTIIRAEGAEELVIGSSLDEEVLQAAGQAASKATKPISDVRCSADYRKDMANVLTRRALKIAYQAAQAS
jgi:carbon-monoxide dehydrogenase medium subunit